MKKLILCENLWIFAFFGVIFRCFFALNLTNNEGRGMCPVWDSLFFWATNRHDL